MVRVQSSPCLPSTMSKQMQLLSPTPSEGAKYRPASGDNVLLDVLGFKHLVQAF
jgi:hypothetical protein